MDYYQKVCHSRINDNDNDDKKYKNALDNIKACNLIINYLDAIISSEKSANAQIQNLMNDISRISEGESL